MLTLGDADAVEQLRAALAVGCTAATHVETDPSRLGPADVAREIAAVVRDQASAGEARTSSCSATTPPTAATSRSASARLRARLAGRQRRGHRERRGRHGRRERERPDGHETYRVPLPAVVTVLEGGSSRATRPSRAG